MKFQFWQKKKKQKQNLLSKRTPTSFSKPQPENITHWQKEQFLKEFNDRERAYFLELVQKCVLDGYPVCLDLYFFCYFSTFKFRILSQMSHDSRFSYLYAWGLKDLTDQIAFYEKRLEKWKSA